MEDTIMSRMPRDVAVKQRSRRKKQQEPLPELAVQADAMRHLLADIRAARDQAAVEIVPNGMIRRQIEMLREAQLLREQLSDSFAP